MKVLFLDRDGVINKDVSYLYRIEDLVWMPGISTGLKLAIADGYKIIVVTNQSGVARGYYSENDVKNLHCYMQEELKKYGIDILDFFYCPHLKDGQIEPYNIDCLCRKPKAGLLEMASGKYDIDISKSFLIGDSDRDIKAAQSFGIDGYLYEDERIDYFIEKILKERKKNEQRI